MGTKVFVGNLAWDVSTEQLKTHMGQAGAVVSADIFSDYDGRSKGCGIVEYSNDSEASKSIKDLHDSTLNGRPIFVREDRGVPENGSKFRPRNRGYRRRYDDRYDGRNRRPNFKKVSDEYAGRQIFVGNLPYTSTKEEIGGLFETCGTIEKITLFTNYDGRSKGACTVVYATPDQAEAAVAKYKNFEHGGRNLICHVDTK